MGPCLGANSPFTPWYLVAAKRAIIQEIERLKGSPKPAKLGQPIALSISPFANGFGRSCMRGASACRSFVFVPKTCRVCRVL